MDKKELYAGAGKAIVDIPENFFQASNEFTGTHDDLHVRAVILENGEQVCLVSIEIPSLWGGVHEMQEMVSRETGVPADHIWIMVSRCFSAPCMTPHVGQDSPQERGPGAGFSEAVFTALRQASRQAAATKRRAYLSFGRGTSLTNINRDIPSADGWWQGLNPDALSDHTVTIFKIEDEERQPIAILYHFGVQSSVLRESGSRMISSDLTGGASSYVEKNSGGVAMLLLGACGNQVPREMSRYSAVDEEGHLKEVDNSAAALDILERLSRELGGDILRIAETACEEVENPGIAMYHRTVELPAFGPGKGGQFHPVPTTRFEYPAVEGKRPVPMSILRIGRNGLLGVQPEINAETAVKLHEDTMFLGTLTVQMVNGSAKYLPQAEAYDRFTYEAMSSFFPKGSAELLMEETVKFLHTVQDGLHSIDPVIAAKYPDRLMDVPYAEEDPCQKMDIWYPNERDGKPLPVVLMLHGGAFQHGDKFEDTTEPMLRGLDRGYVVVSGNYRLAPGATYPAPILDGKRALHYLRANAETLGIDPDRIAVWGYSSGSWLVSMIAVTAGNPSFSVGSEYTEEVQAVIDWCGPCGNFVEMDPAILATGIGRADHNDEHSPESLFMGAKITDIPEKCAEACPITYVGKNTPPVLIIHGDADPVVPLDQSIRFYQALRAAGCDVEIHIEPGKGHHGDYWYHETWLSDLCFDFLDQRLK